MIYLFVSRKDVTFLSFISVLIIEIGISLIGSTYVRKIYKKPEDGPNLKVEVYFSLFLALYILFS